MSKRHRKHKARQQPGPVSSGTSDSGHQPPLDRPRPARGHTLAGRLEVFEQGRRALAPALWALFALLLLLPQFFGVKEGGYDLRNTGHFPLLDNIGHATVFIADEPHYMTLISSVINDGDLDLKNNYANAHRGGLDAGVRFRAFPLDHHAYYYLPEGYRWWSLLVARNRGGDLRWRYAGPAQQGAATGGQEYTCLERAQAGAEAGGLVEAPCRALAFDYLPQHQGVAGLPEYSWHPPFIAWLGYPLLRPFKDSRLLEPAALFLGYLATLLGAAFAYWGLGRFTPSVLVRFAAVGVIFLASPVWHYSRKLLTEPYLAAFYICAFACFFRGRGFAGRYLLCSLFLGLAVTMKSYAILALLPLLYLAFREEWRAPAPVFRRLLPLAGLCTGPFLGGCALLLWHWLQTGNPLVSPAGSPLTGTAEGYGFSLDLFLPNLWNMLLALQWGLLPFCPALAPAAWGWWLLLRQRGQAAFAALAALWMAVPYCLVMAIYDGVRDGVNYGPRYLTPLLPLLLFGTRHPIEALF